MYIDGLGSYRMTDREFLAKMKEQLDGTVDKEITDRLQLVIDRLEPKRLVAAVRRYEDMMIQQMELEDFPEETDEG